jgi:hypothetical protein
MPKLLYQQDNFPILQNRMYDSKEEAKMSNHSFNYIGIYRE